MADEIVTTAPATEAAPPETATDPKTAKMPEAASGSAQLTPEELQAFRDQAAKLGYEIDAGKVTIRERAAFRDERRRAKAAIDEMTRSERAQLDVERATTAKERETHSERLKRVDAIERAIEIGDYQELARLAGKKDWDDLQSDVIAKLADPNYKELQALKRKEAEREEKERKQAEQAEKDAVQRTEAAEENARRAAQYKYRQYLASTLQQSKHPLIATMAEDSTFVDAIYRIQEENWDPATNSTVTPEQAVKMAVRGANLSLEDELRQLQGRLNKGLQSESAPSAPVPVKGKSKTDVAPSAKTEAAPAGKFKNDREWLKNAARRLEEAAARDRDDGKG